MLQSVAQPSHERESNLQNNSHEYRNQISSGYISMTKQGHKEKDLQIKMLNLLINIQIHAVTMDLISDILINSE